MDGTDPRKVTLGRIIAILLRRGWSPPPLTDEAADAIMMAMQLQPDDLPSEVLQRDTSFYTSRQLEVLQLAAEGKTREEIAQELHVSIQTVKGHLTEVLRRGGFRNTTHAVAVAIGEGLITDPEL